MMLSFPLLLVPVLRFTIINAARVDAGHFSADVRTGTIRYRAVATVSGDTALYAPSASGVLVRLTTCKR